MRVGLRISLIFALLAGAASAADWTLIKREGRDYVPLADVARFYALEGVRQAHNDFSAVAGQRSLRGAVGSPELYINNLKFILSYPVAESEGRPLVSRMDLTKLIEPVMRPSRIRGAEQVTTLVLDPGHGGSDSGARCRWGSEKDFALDVAVRARELLRREGLRVYLTRTGDQFLSLDDRVRFANRFTNALFISIHFNSGQPDATGVETFTLAPRGVPSMAADGPRITDLQPLPGHACDAENMALATATHAAMVARSRMFDRGIKRARFVVIRDISLPGVLVEGGFLSNAGDARKVASPVYRQGLATWLAAAIGNYRRAVGGVPPTVAAAGQSVILREEDAGNTEQEAAHGPDVTTGAN